MDEVIFDASDDVDAVATTLKDGGLKTFVQRMVEEGLREGGVVEEFGL
jgi:hypothetical protein